MACQNNVKVMRERQAKVWKSFQKIKQSESRERQRDTRTFLHRGRGFGVLYPASRMYIGAPAHWSANRTTGHKQGR